MKVPKKDATDKNPDFLQEPATEYQSKSEIVVEDEMAELLEKLIKKGLEQIERGETKSHAQVIAEMRIKHNLKY
jgi:predicted transcriptional regulator